MSGATDLLLHLRPCRIDVPFDGTLYTIPALDAVEWIALIGGEYPDLYAVFPKLAGGDAVAHVEDALWEDRVGLDQVGDVALSVIAANADRPWWVTLRVIRAAQEAWDRVHVNRATGMSLAGWLDEVWSKIMENIDPKKKPAWVNDIEAPPKGIQADVDFDAEEAAFLNAMKAVMR